MAGINGKVVPALVAVFASMSLLFLVPRGYFVAATFVSTACMIASAYLLGMLKWPFAPSPRALAIGAASAAFLYLIFVAGASFIDAYHPLGVTSSSENSIYSLIASPSNPLYLQIAVLFFDAAGYESFFRGTLQRKLQPKLGKGSAPAVAALDAAIHILTLNPIWVGTTFLADLVWGLTYQYGRGTQSSFTSHLLWDLAIFILRPVS